MVNLKCPIGTVITAVTFASYGSPSGTCGSFTQSSCHEASSQELVEDLCMGENQCSIVSSSVVFGEPCPVIVKNLRVQVQCDGACTIHVKIFIFCPYICCCVCMWGEGGGRKGMIWYAGYFNILLFFKKNLLILY